MAVSFADHRAPLLAGLVSAVTGTAASLGVVLAAMTAMGANASQTATAVVVATVAYGLLSIVLSWRYRMPISIVWSTPGAALLAAGVGLGLNFSTAVGAFLVSGLLLTLTGLWPTLGRLVGKIPKPIASAMLGGVIFSFCVAPFQASVQYPFIVLPVIAVWLVLYRFKPIWAAPVAIVLGYALIPLQIPLSFANFKLLPDFAFVSPNFDLTAIVSVAIPLYLVTMASQNIPGVAIMGTFDYEVPLRPVLVSTGVSTMVGSFFGVHALNLAAITAALNANEHAHPNPKRRWLASFYGGFFYLLLALLAAPAVSFVLETPRVLILAASGLALLGTMANSLTAAMEQQTLRIPAAISFLVGASGIVAFGIGAAFWALLAGLAVWLVIRPTSRAV
mgnify:CR=1 FL=1